MADLASEPHLENEYTPNTPWSAGSQEIDGPEIQQRIKYVWGKYVIVMMSNDILINAQIADYAICLQGVILQ